VFLPIAIGLVSLGVIYGTAKMITKGEGIPVGAMVFITTGLVSFLLGVVCDQISALRLERYADGQAAR
jgi:hypothetical protein